MICINYYLGLIFFYGVVFFSFCPRKSNFFILGIKLSVVSSDEGVSKYPAGFTEVETLESTDAMDNF